MNESVNPGSEESDSAVAPKAMLSRKKLLVLLGVAGLIIVAFVFFRDALNIENLASREAELKQFQQDNPILVYGAALLVYVVVTGLSLPGAAGMTLVYGWYFGFLRAVVLVSFASTMGATVAFLLSRFLFRDALQKRFGDRLKTFNEALDREGAFYLFTLRLIPAVPFFVINVVMGLTGLPTRTFWWVSQLGMLAGTMVFVYAGSQVPNLQTLAEEGAKAVFSTGQLTQITIAFVVLGLFPITVKKIMNRVRSQKNLASSTANP